MNILITGHQGYVGSVLVPFLRSNMPSVRIIGLDAGYFASPVLGSDPDRSADWNIQGDVRSPPFFLFEGIDAVVHLAAVSNDPMGKRFEGATSEINYDATANLGRMARAAGVKRFVFASSCSVYGAGGDRPRTESDPLDPLTAYALSKVAAERALLDMADRLFQVYALRFATAYGASPRLRTDLVVNDFVASAVKTGKIEVLSDGTPWRPIVHVHDMCRAILWALTNRADYSPGPLNVGTNANNLQVKDLAEAVAKEANATVQVSGSPSPDKRSYQVDFSRFERICPLSPVVSLGAGVRDLSDLLYRVPEFPEKYRDDPRFNRLRGLESHIEAGRLGPDLRWKSR